MAAANPGTRGWRENRYQLVATARLLCRGFLWVATDPRCGILRNLEPTKHQKAHGIDGMPWLPLRGQATNRRVKNQRCATQLRAEILRPPQRAQDGMRGRADTGVRPYTNGHAGLKPAATADVETFRWNVSEVVPTANSHSEVTVGSSTTPGSARASGRLHRVSWVRRRFDSRARPGNNPAARRGARWSYRRNSA